MTVSYGTKTRLLTAQDITVYKSSGLVTTYDSNNNGSYKYSGYFTRWGCGTPQDGIYLKFNNTKGLAIPEGDTASRMSSPEVGTTRFNTDLDYVEVWNGTEWTVSSGTFTTAQDINELSDIWTLILG